MVIVVLSNKVDHIHEPHRLLQARMQRAATNQRFIRSLQLPHKGRAPLPETRQKFAQDCSIVIGRCRPSVGQVRRPQLGSAGAIIIKARYVQLIQIKQMPHLLLNRPLVVEPPRQDSRRQSPGDFIKTWSGTPQTLEEKWKVAGRKIEAEFAFKPRRQCNHHEPPSKKRDYC